MEPHTWPHGLKRSWAGHRALGLVLHLLDAHMNVTRNISTVLRELRQRGTVLSEILGESLAPDTVEACGCQRMLQTKKHFKAGDIPGEHRRSHASQKSFEVLINPPPGWFKKVPPKGKHFLGNLKVSTAVARCFNNENLPVVKNTFLHFRCCDHETRE